MDLRNDEFGFQSEDPSVSGERHAIDIAGILSTLRRRWRYPAFGFLIGLVVAVCYIVFIPSLYKSVARIMLDTSVNRYLQTNKIVGDPTFDETDVGGQLYILSSDRIVIPVIQSMNLTHDSEFVGRPNAENAQPSGYLNKLKRFTQNIIGSHNLDDAIDANAALEQIAKDAFLKRLSVFREDVANVITITFESERSSKAASIANAIADTYIATNLEAKFSSTKIVSRWLQERLMEVKARAADADQALQKFKTANNLVAANKKPLTSEQLSSLNTELINARITVAEAKARLDRIHGMPSDKILSTMMVDRSTNSAKAAKIASLEKHNSDYREVAARATELGSIVGSGHEAVVKLHKRMNELRSLIREEEQQLVDTYADEYQMAKLRESQVVTALSQSELGEAGPNRQIEVTMRELESSADTLRNLYNSFLQKFSEINTIQDQTIPVQNAHIISRATAPVHKSSKKQWAVFGLSIMLGSLLGAGTAIAREWVAGVVRSPKVIEHVTGVHCVIVPTVKANEELTSFGDSTRSNGLTEYVLDAPYSRFTEAIRNLKAFVSASQCGGGVKVIGIVSSVAREGKTTIAANLGAVLSGLAGARTLIIDSDIHRRRLTAALAPDADKGLIEALADPSRLATLVFKRRRAGVDILPCALSGRIPNAAELIGSPSMGRLLAEARNSYDFIIIEIAPIMSVVDLKMIERFVDGFIFVVEWGQTKRELIQDALSEVEIIRDRLLGVVLNKVDARGLRTIEARKGDKVGEYYQEEILTSRRSVSELTLRISGAK